MKLKYLFFSILFAYSFIAKSQISNINTIFSLSTYGFFSQDSNNYLYNQISNYSDLSNLIDSVCPFYTADYYTNLNEITTADSITKLYGLHNQVPWKDTEFVEMKSAYSFKNKNSAWYGFYKRSWGDTTVAFLVIPGSGNHESFKIASGDLNDYHNMNGKVREACLKYGDFYVYSKQNEDFNGIWKNIGGDYNRLDYDYLTPYTDFAGKHWAANMYIDIVAAVKYLKKKYRKVIIMGLSNAGFPALICGLQGEADGISCASGISSYSYNGFLVPNNENPYFSNLLNFFTFDSLRTLMSQTKTDVLFSYGANDGGGNEFEYNTHSIEDTFAANCNASYFYNFNGHTFPTNDYDTFFTKIINQPNVNIMMDESVCTADSINVQLHFKGSPPINFDVYKNNIFIQHKAITDTICTIELYSEGIYQLKNIIDVNNSPLCKSKSFTYTKDKKPIIDSVANIGRDCMMEADQLKIYLNGNSPFNISSNIPGNSFVTENNNSHLYTVPIGTYTIFTIQDSNNCTNAINYPLGSTRDSLLFSVVQGSYNCDSLKTKFIFSYRGTSPWTLHYMHNGQTIQRISYANTDSVYLENGLLNIISLQDSTNCIHTINQLYTINHDTLNSSNTNPIYACDSNKTFIQFHLNGVPPWVIHYSKDFIIDSFTSYNQVANKYFENGHYDFQQVTDGAGCSKLINHQYDFIYDTLSFFYTTPIYNCDSNKTDIHVELGGNPPLTIYCTKNAIPFQWTINSNSADTSFVNGIYYFISITDATNCSKPINVIENFTYQPIQYTTTNPLYTCDSNKMKIQFHFEGNSPFTINYTKNSISSFFTSTGFDKTQYCDNGDYIFTNVTDATGCIATINNSYTFNLDTLNIVMGTPIYDCDSNKTKIHFELQGNPPYTIHYTKNAMPLQWTTNSNNVDTYFTNGVYQFTNIIDSTNCTKAINNVYNINNYPLQVSMSNPVYVCDSNTMKILYHFDGNAPFTIHYTRNTIPLSFTTTGFDTTQFYTNADYTFQHVTDATGCNTAINNPFTFNHDTLAIIMGTPAYSCDSNKTKIHVELQGNPPFTIYYLENLVNKQCTTSLPSFDLYFQDGNYFFQQIIDSTGCQKNINQFYLFSSQPMSGIITQQSYNCDSNKYELKFAFTGVAPWYLEYTDGVNVFTKTTLSPTMSLFLDNGNWVINQATNNVGCIQYFNTPVSVSFNSISANIVSQSFDCDSNKLKVQFALTGNPPWIIHYVKNNPFPVYYNDTTNNAAHLIYLGSGSYLFLNVTDMTGCSFAPPLQSVWNYYTILTAQQTTQSFNCDSNKVEVDYALTGDGPWTIQYKNNNSGTTYNVNTTIPSVGVYLANGNYTVLSVQDANCFHVINDTINVNYTLLNSIISPLTISCDSNKYFINFISNGGTKPYSYEYFYNGVMNSLTSNTDTTLLYLPNGNYLFTKTTDSLGCAIQYNVNQSPNYADFHFNTISSTYICNKDSTAVTFNITHQQGLWLSYIQNGSITDTVHINGTNTFTFSNGTYNWLVLYDSLGCRDTIDEETIINNVPVNYSPITIDKDCDTREYIYHFNLTGKSPWQLSYNLNNIFDTLALPSKTYDWRTSSGLYYLIELKDSNNCKIFIGKSDTLIPFFPQTPTLQLIKNNFVTDAGGYQYFWYQNNVLIDSISGNSISSYGDGEYYVAVHDETGCVYESNKITVHYPSPINVYPNPSSSYSTVLINEKYGNYWDYVLIDMHGNKLFSGFETKSFKEFDLRNLPAGIYNLIILYEEDFSKHIIRLMKQ